MKHRWRWARAWSVAWLVMSCLVWSAPGSPGWAQMEFDNFIEFDPNQDVSPEFRRTLEQGDEERRRKAVESGDSFVGTPLGVLPAQLAPKKGAPAVLSPAKVSRPGKAEPQAMPGRPRPAAPEYGASEFEGSERRDQLSEMLRALFATWSEAPQVVRVRYPVRETSGVVQAARSAAAEAGPGDVPEVGTGDGIYARTVYEVNSDYPGPVVVELLEPPLVGAVATGEFDQVRDRLVVRLTSLSWRGREFEIDAWAVGLDCACYGLSAEVDRHWWSRLVLPAAIRFAEGFLLRRGEPEQTVAVEGGTVVESRSKATKREAVYTGLGQAARSVGDILLQGAPTRPTVRIPRDSEIVAVFVRPPGTAPSVRAVSTPPPGPRGPVLRPAGAALESGGLPANDGDGDEG